MDQQIVQDRLSRSNRETTPHRVPPAEAAGRRVLAYLRLLPMTEERRLELTLEILRDLTATSADDEQAPARAMSLLRTRLQELENEGMPSAAVPPARPALIRGHMVPEEMDRRPWLTQAARLAQGYHRLANRKPALKPRVIWPVLFVVFLLMHLFVRELS